MWRGKNKFKAVRTNGLSSKLEAAVYNYLLRREEMGEIEDIKLQQPVVLQAGGRDTRITWKVDFSFWHKTRKERIYAEAKGMETGEYRIKLKLWRAAPPFSLEIYKGNYKKIYLAEKIDKDANNRVDEEE